MSYLTDGWQTEVRRVGSSTWTSLPGSVEGERTGVGGVDDYVVAVKKRDALRSEASNVVDHGPRAASRNRVPRPRPDKGRLADRWLMDAARWTCQCMRWSRRSGHCSGPEHVPRRCAATGSATRSTRC